MDPNVLTLLALAAPGAFGVVALAGFRNPGRAPAAALRTARIAVPISFLGVAVCVAQVGLIGPVTTPLLGAAELGFSLRLDALSVTMLALVAFMGAVVVRYSRTYLDGDARHGAFMGGLALTVANVMMLVLAGNLVHLVAFWATTSFALHRLLLFYPERRGAVVAARKKFIVARAGDVLLACAALLLWTAFGTGDLVSIAERAATAPTGGLAPSTSVAAVLVVLSAALKSAVFPTHGWLLDVMETPTPVSALLHAGIINGGTFLVARLADVVVGVPVAMHGLVLIGAVTAVVASVVLTTQTSVKVALGWSSAAHMGFMLMLCGLGAFPVAILHLVAHSFYKAHAFLSSGSAVEAPRTPTASEGRPPSWLQIGSGFVVAGTSVVVIGGLLGVNVAEDPVTLGLCTIISVALTQLWAGGLAASPSPGIVLGRTALWSTSTTLAFFGLELTAAAILGDAVPAEPLNDPTTLALMTLVVTTFATVVALQLRLPALARRPAVRTFRVHARNGFYANTLFDRLVGAWHVAADSRATSPRTAP